jgi:hypothetical protein
VKKSPFSKEQITGDYSPEKTTKLSIMAIEHKRLGKHGVFVSNICLGTMNFGWHTAKRMFEKSQADARRLRIRRIAARSISVSEVCTLYS